MRIDRCYCFQKTFAELKTIAQRSGACTLQALQKEVTFGKRCRLCHPYVRRMLRTGEVIFYSIIREEDEPQVDPSEGPV